MRNPSVLRIENRRPPTESQIDDDDNLRNRVGELLEQLRKDGFDVQASVDSHPWYLHLDKISPADLGRVCKRCDEVAATLQIELG